MRAQMEFCETLANLETPSSTLEVAVDEILECESLTQLLLVILNAGNVINAVSYKLSPLSLPLHLLLLSHIKGTFRGDAYGFTIGSLKELKQTKSRYSEVYFLHFIAQVCCIIIDSCTALELTLYTLQVCEDQSPDLLQILSKLPNLQKASRYGHNGL